METGPSPQTPQAERCCGSKRSLVALTRDGAAPSRVELVRCAVCSQTSWRLDGVDVSKDEALSALSAAYAPASPARKATPLRSRPQSTPAASPAAAPAAAPSASPSAELSELLAGWQVLGSH